MASAIRERRQPGKVTHPLRDLLRQRVFGLACGYADCNDAARLGDDPIHKLLLDRDPLDGAAWARSRRCRCSKAPWAGPTSIGWDGVGRRRADLHPERLGQERPRLRPLPIAAAAYALKIPVVVSARARVAYEGGEDSMPPETLGQPATLHLYRDRIAIVRARRAGTPVLPAAKVSGNSVPPPSAG